VAQHKTPQAPRLTRKNFDRKMPDAGRHLLAVNSGAVGPRQFTKVAAHKTPNTPQLTRKNFQLDGRHLLALDTGENTGQRGRC
jgi:hypothetical protein